MKSENIKYPDEYGLIKELLNNASEARRFYLKYDFIDRIISLFTLDEEQSNDSKWHNLISLQERINIIKEELGEDEANVLMCEITDQLSEYLFVNNNIKKEAIENINLLSNIQENKIKTLEKILSIDGDN